MTKVISFPITPADRPKVLLALQEAVLATRNRFHGDKYGRFFHTTIFTGRHWSREELEYQQHAASLLTDALAREELIGFVQPRVDGGFYQVNSSYWYSYGIGGDAINEGRLLFSVIDQLSLPEGVVGAPIYLDRNAFDAWLTKPIPSSEGASPIETTGADTKHGGGRRPELLEQVKQTMRNDIKTDKHTVAKLGKMKQKELAAEYGCSRETAVKALAAIRPEFAAN